MATKKQINHEKKQKVNEVALKNAKIILKDVGIDENDVLYSLRLYEMSFSIYHALKITLDI